MAEHNSPMNPQRLNKRLAFTDMDVTLNGKPAKLSGVHKPFATVTDLATGLSAEWSWEAVENVMRKGGHFKS